MDNVQEQINNELFNFQHEVYKGKVKVPHDILETFLKCVFALPPQVHGLSARKIKAIYQKNVSQLTNGELQDIIKVVFNTPLEKIFIPTSKLPAIDEQIKFEDFVREYHALVDEFQKKLQMKKATLQSLSHGGGSGMKILRN